ncbi:hypothetical protein HMPREF1989_00099 [Porphyromonas gingivalis F0566]|nr:hypothetical protein HMPREF1989_00099 [Porphyromonas gingivalis F0566]
MSSQRTIVKREDIEQMLAERPYEKRQPRDAIVITELLGTDIYTVSKMLTHKNVSTTQIYADLVNSKKRETAEKISLK